MAGDRPISYQRDKDYRGQFTTVDWSRLMYLARRRRPGALEVLQDAIETYFPRQFKAAKDRARRKSKGYKSKGYGTSKVYPPQEFYVLFDSSIARRRFRPKALKRKRYKGRNQSSIVNRSPVFEQPAKFYPHSPSTSEFGTDVVVWSTKSGNNVEAR